MVLENPTLYTHTFFALSMNSSSVVRSCLVFNYRGQFYCQFETWDRLISSVLLSVHYYIPNMHKDCYQ